MRRTSGFGTVFVISCILGVFLTGCGGGGGDQQGEAAPDTAAAGGSGDLRAIVKEAYLYGWPMSENFNTLYAYALDKSGSEYKAPFNQLHNTARVYTPADKAVVTPNSDTPYSFVWADLRAEPLVLTVPAMEPERYFSFQLIDLYTFNFVYIGTGTTGNEGGKYLLAGPEWKGEAPAGIDKVYRSETEFILAVGRTQLFDAADLENVKKIQAGYKVQPLSAFLGESPPAPAPDLVWPAPQAGEAGKTAAIFTIVNFMLELCPTVPSETELMQRFARIGVGAGVPFEVSTLSPEMMAAFEGGIADAWQAFAGVEKEMATGKLNSGDCFGTRKFLENNYLLRFAGAKLGLYGNSREEALYPIYSVDAAGQPLDAARNDYVVTFAERIPTKAFWSLTMYDGKTQLLIENPIHRYLINSPMLDELQRGADSSVTIYVQKDSPGADKESNWLPAPDGPFYAVLRLYIPEKPALDGSWKAPPMKKVE